MNIIKVKDYNEMSSVVADLTAEQIRREPRSVLGLATGSTPIGAYRRLAEKELDFSQIKTVNLDEYVGLDAAHPQSYRRFMDENLFSHINIQKINTHIPNGAASDIAVECERYEALIRSLGGIDLQLLGMGGNGHIAFNEPAEELSVQTHHVRLAEDTVRANSRFFNSIDDVPKSSITMGIGSIMSAKKIILAVSGINKADIIKKALYGSITTQIPASLLRLHHNVTVVADCLD